MAFLKRLQVLQYFSISFLALAIYNTDLLAFYLLFFGRKCHKFGQIEALFIVFLIEEEEGVLMMKGMRNEPSQPYLGLYLQRFVVALKVQPKISACWDHIISIYQVQHICMTRLSIYQLVNIQQSCLHLLPINLLKLCIRLKLLHSFSLYFKQSRLYLLDMKVELEYYFDYSEVWHFIAKAPLLNILKTAEKVGDGLLLVSRSMVQDGVYYFQPGALFDLAGLKEISQLMLIVYPHLNLVRLSIPAALLVL